MKGCRATGVTISGQQVKLARMLTSKEARVAEPIDDGDSFVGLGAGGVRYMELDAESTITRGPRRLSSTASGSPKR